MIDRSDNGGYDVYTTTQMVKALTPNGKDIVSVRIEPQTYSRRFDSSCDGWCEDINYTLHYLRIIQDHACKVLLTKKKVYLNDVYHWLGYRPTKIGEFIGWVYNEDNPIGDNYVDFGLCDECNIDFIKGIRNYAILNFNVDGYIKDRI